MSRCLCCNKELKNPTAYEAKVEWHARCIKEFFGTEALPELDLSETELEKLANAAVNKGLTVPGVQKKLSLHLESGENPARLTIVDYPSGYILKPQSGDYAALPEAEYCVMQMAKTAKISIVPCALLRGEGGLAYITKRIDRRGEKMYAMEDFCQLSLRPSGDKYKGSYEACGKIIEKYSKNVGLDLADFYYRLLFCFVTGNSDMHLKNFSLIEEEPGSRIFGLSEAYDLLPVNVILPSDKDQMALTVNGKKRNIRRKDFLSLAESLGLKTKTAEGLIQQICGYRMNFLEEVRQSFLPQDMKERLIGLMEKRLEVLA